MDSNAIVGSRGSENLLQFRSGDSHKLGSRNAGRQGNRCRTAAAAIWGRGGHFSGGWYYSFGLDRDSLWGTSSWFPYGTEIQSSQRCILKEILTHYFAKHLEIHRSADAFNFVSQQSDELRARLSQTEEELKQLKDKARVTSLPESTANLNAELLKTRDALRAAQTEHAEQQALLQELEKPLPGQDEKLQNAEDFCRKQ